MKDNWDKFAIIIQMATVLAIVFAIIHLSAVYRKSGDTEIVLSAEMEAAVDEALAREARRAECDSPKWSSVREPGKAWDERSRRTMMWILAGTCDDEEFKHYVAEHRKRRAIREAALELTRR